MRFRVPAVVALLLASCARLPGTDNAVEVRVHNLSSTDFDSVIVQFPDDTHRYGAVAAGARSGYASVHRAYRYARIVVWIEGAQHVIQPIDYTGERTLPAGQHTYGLTFTGEPPQLGIVMADEYRARHGSLRMPTPPPARQGRAGNGRNKAPPAGWPAGLLSAHGTTITEAEGLEPPRA